MDSLHVQAVNGWKDAMRSGRLNGRLYSESVITAYTLYVKKFLAEYGEITLAHYKTALTRIPVQQAAKRLKLYEAIHCFVRYLVRANLMDGQYLQDVKQYKPRRALPAKKMHVSQTNLECLLSACRNELERLIIILLSQTGLRAREAASLALSDLDLERQILTVQSATGVKPRRIGLTNPVIQAIRQYLSQRPAGLSPRLFLNSQGKAINCSGIQIRLRKLGQLAGVAVTPHALRQTFVTLNVNKGIPLVMLQMMCGHGDIATTRSYYLITEE